MKGKVLFLCTGNSCRSQMAEGLLKALRPQEFEVYSAGTRPKPIDPMAVEVTAELGIDISGQSSKHIDELGGIEFDYVITLCEGAKESCPFFPAKRRFFHKGFEDPPALVQKGMKKEEILNIYRRVRDEIKAFIEDLDSYL
ncbi:MAG: arsenate reductase ArsC [Desulfatiglandales bacterium]